MLLRLVSRGTPPPAAARPLALDGGPHGDQGWRSESRSRNRRRARCPEGSWEELVNGLVALEGGGRRSGDQQAGQERGGEQEGEKFFIRNSFLAGSRGGARTAKDGLSKGVCPDIIKGDSIPIVHPLYRIEREKTRRKLLRNLEKGVIMEYTIVPMDRSHVGQIAELERECFSTPLGEAMLTEALFDAQASFIVAESEDGGLLGYAGLHVVLDEGYIDNIAVDPNARRHGVADELLDVFCRFGAANLASLRWRCGPPTNRRWPCTASMALRRRAAERTITPSPGRTRSL